MYQPRKVGRLGTMRRLVHVCRDQLSFSVHLCIIGEVHAVAALSNEIIVSGSNDNMVSVWKRIPGTLNFATIHICPEHQHQLRSVLALPPSPLCPTGGFATAGLDKTIRVYGLDAATDKVRDSWSHCLCSWLDSLDTYTPNAR